MTLTRLTIMVTIATLLLSGCSTSTPNAAALLQYLKGEKVETATPETLNPETVYLWNSHSNEKLITLAEGVCALMSTTTETAAAKSLDISQAFTTMLLEIYETDTTRLKVNNPEDSILRFAMLAPAAQIYCPEHKNNLLSISMEDLRQAAEAH